MPNGEINRYPYCPVPFGRTTFAAVADKFIQDDREVAYPRGQFFLEYGSTRSYMDMGAGYSTPFLTWLADKTNHCFVSIDNKENVTEISNKICADYLPTAKPAHTADAMSFSLPLNDKICLLYLDAYDYDGSDENKEFSKQKHLELFALCEPHLADHALVMIDDVLHTETWEGKGQLLIPHLLEKGYKLLVKDYCCLFEKP